ncbi:hypothetical protein FRC04_007982 [Tulasnella sp. 424]|nr:hypothetical protein FRC04_007982 [Tulasnella sp. 424]
MPAGTMMPILSLSLPLQQQTCLQTIAQVDFSSNAYVTYLPDASVGLNGAFYVVKFTSLNNKDPANPTSYSANFTLNASSSVLLPSVYKL